MKLFKDYFKAVNNDLIFADENFENDTFESFQLHSSLSNSVIIENCNFINCKSFPGACVISSQFKLKNVLFSNFDCGKEMNIHHDSLLENVTISGVNPKLLSIKPSLDIFEPNQGYSTIETVLDITRYEGEVKIIGIPSSKVKINKDKHFIVKSSWKTDVDWSTFDQFSFIKSCVKSVIFNQNEEGIFSLPSDKSKIYPEAKDALEKLKQQSIKLN